MANINFSQTIDNGQQFVLTKEGLQGLAGATVTTITGPTTNNGSEWNNNGAKYITFYKGDGTSASIPVGSNISFPDTGTDDNNNCGKARIQVDGTLQYASIVGITPSTAANILPATYDDNGNTVTYNLGGSGTNEAWNCIYANNLFIGNNNITSFLPQSKGNLDQFWCGAGAAQNATPHWDNALTIEDETSGNYVAFSLIKNSITKGSLPDISQITNIDSNNPRRIGSIYFRGKDSVASDKGSLCRINAYLQSDNSNNDNSATKTIFQLTAFNNEANSTNKTLFELVYDKNPVGAAGSYESYAQRVHTGESTPFRATKVFNAVFNDYAEYRTTINLTPGHVVIDQDNGSLTCSSARLQPGAQVISDTFGHSMGETDTAKTPIAVAGRVLVYPYQARENYHAGMTVCSAPDGTVDIMTREEIRDYPDCIVGIVSEIPEYETWGSDNVKVNGRIWIRVK